MGPMRKDFLDKAAWAWAETTDPESVTLEHVKKAYRIDLPECKPGTCRRNCRGSPRCLSGLGEQRWLSEPNEDSASSYVDDPNIDRRDSGSFIGLKNLGATCYVNSLLQLWFHNLEFRKAIYEWDPMDDPDERLSLEVDETKFPVTHVGHLQVLFANLQFSLRRYIDPSDFVHSLGLDTNLQQDAQEFSKLFISMLEDRLATQTKPSVHDMIIKNFRGEYQYLTKCSKCLRESTRPSTFYELDLNIQGHRTLGDSLTEFLHEEKLEGANKYHCAICGDMQDATRCIQLKSLPPVLHLQLLRFVYDRSKGHKKKLNSVIQFPEVLDMSEYVGLPPGTKIYNVSAVLVHMGSSAHSGHYIAHIKDSASGNWHKYNDESVEKIEGKKLTLSSEEDGTEAPQVSKGKGRPQKCVKGFINSKNAYMLVYTLATQKNDENVQVCPSSTVSSTVSSPKSNGVERHGICSNALEKEMKAWGLAKRLVDKVNEQNRKFEEWTTEEFTKRETFKVQTQFHRNEMLELFSKLTVKASSETFDFISADWLNKVFHEGLGDESRAPTINNNYYMCVHGRIDPTKVTSMKIIGVEAGHILYKRFSGGPRLQGFEAMCLECVRRKCAENRLINKIASDRKEITNLLKYRMDQTDPGYWVGKNTLKSWKSIVLRSLRPSTNGKEYPETKEEIEKNDSDARDETEENYDENLRLHNSRKRGKSESDHMHPTKRLHLPDSSSSKSSGSESEEKGSGVDGMASSEGPQDVKEEASSPSEERRDEESNEDLSSNCLGFNDDAVCAHGNLNVDESSRRLVPPRIWAIFQSYFPSAKEFPRHSQVCLTCQEKVFEGERVRDNHRKAALQQKEFLNDFYLGKNRPNLDPASRKTKAVNGTICNVEGTEEFNIISQDFADRWKNFIGRRSEPPLRIVNEELLCQHQRLLYDPANPDDCYRQLVLLWPYEWDTLRNFYSSDIDISCVRDLLTGEITTSPAVCEECQASRREAKQAELCTYSRAKIFVRRVVDDTKMDVAQQAAVADCADPEFQVSCPTSAAGSESIRRSARSRKPRGDKELTVSSDQTLLELKVEIYKHFQVAPFDQHLSLDGRPLVGAEQTLGALNVYPRSIVLLKADEPSEDSAIVDDDYIKSAAPEEGFKGTGLLSR